MTPPTTLQRPGTVLVLGDPALTDTLRRAHAIHAVLGRPSEATSGEHAAVVHTGPGLPHPGLWQLPRTTRLVIVGRPDQHPASAAQYIAAGAVWAHADAVHAAIRGTVVLPVEQLRSVLHQPATPLPHPPLRLTPKQLAALSCILAGLDTTAGADHLGIPLDTAKSQRRSLYRALGCDTALRAAAIGHAHRAPRCDWTPLPDIAQLTRRRGLVQISAWQLTTALRHRHPPGRTLPTSAWGPAPRAVLRCLLAGQDIATSAATLRCSPETIKSHRAALARSLGVSTALETAAAVRMSPTPPTHYAP